MTYTYNPKLAKDASAWNFMYGKNTPAHPKPNVSPDGQNAVFKFDIPPYPAQVDYLIHEPAGLAIPGGIRVDLRIVATSGKLQFIPDPGSTVYSGCRIADRGDAFPTLLKNLWRVGLTFGGGTAYAGHGVSVTGGTCRIYVYRYSAY